MIIRGLDALDRCKQPQRRIQRPRGSHKRSRLWNLRSVGTLQNALEFARNRIQPGLQARSVQFAATGTPAGDEQAFHDVPDPLGQLLQQVLLDRSASESRVSVRPADLAGGLGEFAVGRPAVAADDSGDRVTQKGL